MGKLELVKKYFSLLETFSTNEALYSEILHPDMQQVELPNLLNKQGQASTRMELFRRMELGKKMLSGQSYEISGFIETENRLAVEATWRGKMAIDAGPLKAGQEMKAFFCIILELKDGKIHRQRNYDCFEPLA